MVSWLEILYKTNFAWHANGKLASLNKNTLFRYGSSQRVTTTIRNIISFTCKIILERNIDDEVYEYAGELLQYKVSQDRFDLIYPAIILSHALHGPTTTNRLCNSPSGMVGETLPTCNLLIETEMSELSNIYVYQNRYINN